MSCQQIETNYLWWCWSERLPCNSNHPRNTIAPTANNFNFNTRRAKLAKKPKPYYLLKKTCPNQQEKVDRKEWQPSPHQTRYTTSSRDDKKSLLLSWPSRKIGCVGNDNDQGKIQTRCPLQAPPKKLLIFSNPKYISKPQEIGDKREPNHVHKLPYNNRRQQGLQTRRASSHMYRIHTHPCAPRNKRQPQFFFSLLDKHKKKHSASGFVYFRCCCRPHPRPRHMYDTTPFFFRANNGGPTS